MATFENPVHRSQRDGLQHLDLAYDPSLYTHHKARPEMDSLSEMPTSKNKVNIFIVFVFILEILVLVFVSVLEYFFRRTDVFPVREVTFSCTDPAISYSQGASTYDDFAYNADVSYEVLASLSFCIPPFLIVVCELAFWAYTAQRQKTIRALCKQCRMPQLVRRMMRFVGVFLFGLLVTMIFVDVTKIFVGRLRPIFLEICQPDMNQCSNVSDNTQEVCMERNDDKLRDARLSFPSMHAAMSSFAATFMAVYLHCVMHVPGLRMVRPFLSLGFMVCAVMCALARYGLNYSHWTDVMVGFGVGLIFALYLGIFVLNEFRERLGSQQLYYNMRRFLSYQRALERPDFYKERGRELPWYWSPWHWTVQDRLERNPYYTYPGVRAAPGDAWLGPPSLAIPRPHVSNSVQAYESTTDGDLVREPPLVSGGSPRSDPEISRAQRYRLQDTFQRDLNRAIFQYRTTNPYGVGHI